MAPQQAPTWDVRDSLCPCCVPTWAQLPQVILVTGGPRRPAACPPTPPHICVCPHPEPRGLLGREPLP